MPENDSIFAGLPDNLPKEGAKDEAPKVKLPEQLQGKSAEEMYQVLSQAHIDEVNNAVNAVKATFAQKKPENGQQQTPQPQAAPQAQAQPQPQNYGPYSPGAQAQDGEPDMISDSEGWMAAQFNKRIAPYEQAVVSSQRESNRQLFEMQNKEKYSKYKDEIESIVSGFTPQVQMNPKAYGVAFNYVRSVHIDDEANELSDTKVEEKVLGVLSKLGIDTEQAKAVMVVPPAQPAAPQAASLFQGNIGMPVVQQSTQPVVGSTGKGSVTKLTPAEKHAAEQFGMGDDEYREYSGLNTDMMSQVRRSR